MKKIHNLFLDNIFRLFKYFFLPVFLIATISFEASCLGQLAKTEIEICKGTKYQTTGYIISSGQEGNTVMIMSGVHGNELAGIEATKELIKNIRPRRGELIIIPEVNIEACKLGLRTINSGKDLNRIYPGDTKSQGINRLAGEIFEIMQEKDIDFLLDLHESVEYYNQNPSHYGQTIILDGKTESLYAIANYLKKELNNKVVLPENYFEIIIEPIKGSSTYEALNNYNIPGITFETCIRIEFNKRVTFHSQCIEKILLYFNIL